MNSRIKASYYVGCVDGSPELSIIKYTEPNKSIYVLRWGHDLSDLSQTCWLNEKGYFDSFDDARKAMYKYYDKKWIREIK